MKELKINLQTGVAALRKKQFNIAEIELTKAINARPKNAEAYYQRGRAMLGLKKYMGAIKDFNKAFMIDPTLKKARKQISSSKKDFISMVQCPYCLQVVLAVADENAISDYTQDEIEIESILQELQDSNFRSDCEHLAFYFEPFFSEEKEIGKKWKVKMNILARGIIDSLKSNNTGRDIKSNDFTTEEIIAEALYEDHIALINDLMRHLFPNIKATVFKKQVAVNGGTPKSTDRALFYFIFMKRKDHL